MIRLENGEHLPASALRDRIAKAAGVTAASIHASDEDEEDDSAVSLDLILQRRIRQLVAEAVEA